MMDSLVYWSTVLLLNWFIDSLTHCFNDSLVRWLADSLWFTESLLHWFTGSVVQSFISSLIAWFVHLVVQGFFHVMPLATMPHSLVQPATSTTHGFCISKRVWRPAISSNHLLFQNFRPRVWQALSALLHVKTIMFADAFALLKLYWQPSNNNLGNWLANRNDEGFQGTLF